MTDEVTLPTPRPDYHIRLFDGDQSIGLVAVNSNNQPDPDTIGRSPVERSSLKTSQGNQKYSDLQPPYTALAQDDWSGGRASPDLDQDASRYKDGLRVNTERPGRAFLSGRETYCPLFGRDQNLPGSMKMVSLIGQRNQIKRSFICGGTYDRQNIWLWVRKKGTPKADLEVDLYPAASPNSVVTAILDVDDLDPLVSEFRILPIASTALTSGTEYVIEIKTSALDGEDNHWEIGALPTDGSTYEYDHATPAWVGSDFDLYFRVTYTPTDAENIFFEYKRSLYTVTKPRDGATAAELYMNGWRGAAIANTGALTKLKVAGTPFTADEYIGCIVVIIEGAGSTEAQNWRLITDNANNELTVDTAWLITHDTTTCYVILGSNNWKKVTTTAILTKPVTDVLVSSRNVVYFAQGEGAVMQRMREYNNSGTWTRQFAAEAVTAIFLDEYDASGNIGSQIVRSNSDSTISRAYPQDWGTGLTFGWSAPTTLNAAAWQATHAYSLYDLVKPTTANGYYYQCSTAGNSGGTEPAAWPITPESTLVDGAVLWIAHRELQFTAATTKLVGDATNRITGLVRYVDENQNEAIWILKESSPWMLRQDDQTGMEMVQRVKLAEMSGIRSEKNGRVFCTSGVYLFFTVLNSLHRFYHPNLDDVGPTLDEGLPAGRQGPVSAIVAYPGRIFIAIDAGSSGYSAVFSSSGGAGWHELYRAPFGQRIHSLAVQVIPGTVVDRLWIGQGGDIIWLPLPSETFDPTQDALYPFAHEGVLELSAMFAGLQDAWKYWNKLKVHAENLITDTCWIEADYKVDDAEEWTEMGDRFEETPFDEVEFGEAVGESGKKLSLRIRMYSISLLESPKLLALIVSAVVVTEPKFSYSLAIKVTDKDLNGNLDASMQPHEKIRLLDEWAGTARPLLMSCPVNPLYDGIKVFLQPAPARPLLTAVKVEENTYICTIMVQEA